MPRRQSISRPLSCATHTRASEPCYFPYPGIHTRMLPAVQIISLPSYRTLNENVNSRELGIWCSDIWFLAFLPSPFTEPWLLHTPCDPQWRNRSAMCGSNRRYLIISKGFRKRLRGIVYMSVARRCCASDSDSSGSNEIACNKSDPKMIYLCCAFWMTHTHTISTFVSVSVAVFRFTILQEPCAAINGFSIMFSQVRADSRTRGTRHMHIVNTQQSSSYERRCNSKTILFLEEHIPIQLINMLLLLLVAPVSFSESDAMVRYAFLMQLSSCHADDWIFIREIRMV